MVTVMMEFLMSAAQNPVTPLMVLSGAFFVILIEAWKVSHVALMGDIFAEGFDD